MSSHLKIFRKFLAYSVNTTQVENTTYIFVKHIGSHKYLALYLKERQTRDMIGILVTLA